MDYMTKKVLIIGSNSFSGSYVVKKFLESGFEVLGISRSKENTPEFLRYRFGDVKLKNFGFQQLDLNTDFDQLSKIADRFKPSIIANFSAQGMVAESWHRPLDWFQTNVLAQIQLVEYLKNKDYLDLFLQFTTPEVYGSTSDWIDEETPFNPSTPYATSRAAFDFHLKNMFEAYKFPVIFTRAANVYGPGQQIYRIIPRAILSCLLDEKFPLHGSGSSERAFIHMKDVAEAVFTISNSGIAGQTYHISTNETLTISMLVGQIGEFYGKSITDFSTIVDERVGKDQSYKLSSKKLRTEFNWRPTISLPDGMIEVDNWMRENLDKFKSVDREYRHKK